MFWDHLRTDPDGVSTWLVVVSIHYFSFLLCCLSIILSKHLIYGQFKSESDSRDNLTFNPVSSGHCRTLPHANESRMVLLQVQVTYLFQ